MARRPFIPYAGNSRLLNVQRGVPMAKTISWSDRAYNIRERVSRSTTQTWRRRDIERLFEVKRASAQNLMKLIGNVQTIGSTHFLDRSSLLQFLDEAVAAEHVSETV